MYGLHAKLISQDIVSTEKKYVAMAKNFLRQGGYYQLVIYLSQNSKNEQKGAYVSHALRVFSNGSGSSLASLKHWKSVFKNIRSGQQVDRHLTLYDSNLGECHVLPEEMGQFMTALAEFYKTSRNCDLIGITEIYLSQIQKPLEETMLQGLNMIDYSNQLGAHK